MQQILKGYRNIETILKEIGDRHYLLVCDSSFPFLPIKDLFHTDLIFNQFTPNPLYEQVCRGVELFNASKCDVIVAVGGGSTIDVAKCIKLYSGKNLDDISLIAMPTTAGTGSESTRYAVIYADGKKQSITDEKIIPNYAILEPALLKTLPLYQKKCTMMDAFCQGIESWWSVNSTDESKNYSRKAVARIIANWRSYIFDNNEEAAENIMLAANFAGRAINITQTTAPHAMSYKLTSMYGLPHGLAVAVCLPVVWRYMTEHPDQCIDPRGKDYLLSVFNDIADAATLVQPMLTEMDLQQPVANDRTSELETLANSVNPIRLKNNPIQFDHDTLYGFYHSIVK